MRGFLQDGTMVSPNTQTIWSELPKLKHIALIMDGNGRWAQQRGLPRMEGHRVADRNMLGIINLCLELNIPYLTIYVFSTENWKRPPEEVNGMIQLVGEIIERHISQLVAWNVRLVHLGSMEGIDACIRAIIERALERTTGNTGLTIGVALNYGGRSDLTRAIRKIISERVDPRTVTERTISAALSTHALPEPDLIIRTSGERRLSNFLLWEGVNCVFWTTPVLWPDFTPEHLYEAIETVTRYRRLPEQLSSHS